jgi:phenylacetate-CoA ligase
MAERLGGTDPLYDFASLYGTADAGVLGNETPLSIAVRRFLASRPEAARELFGEARLPTLVQYDPMSRFFEADASGAAGGGPPSALLFTGDGGIPLVRYAILDFGGVVPYADMMASLARFGFDPTAELARGGARPLPFVFVFGRSDFTVSFYGANVFPENVTVGLEQPGVREWVTGKFVMQVEEQGGHPRLRVVVELAPGEQAADARRDAAARSIEEQLCRLNSEFASYVPDGRRTPSVELVETADPAWFPIGVKHRYTRRPS